VSNRATAQETEAVQDTAKRWQGKNRAKHCRFGGTAKGARRLQTSHRRHAETHGKHNTKRDGAVESIEAHVIKIGMVEMEIESVRMRNKAMRDENSKLKEKISRTARECEQQQNETASFKPQMLDMVDTMVVEYRKIMHQIALLDEKQKRILLEKWAIIAHMQQPDSQRKRKTPDDTAEASTSSVAP